MQRFLAVIFALFVGIATAAPSFAQADSCSSLKRKIRSYERNSDFKNGQENDSMAKSALKEVKKWESQFVRSGCQKVLNAGGKLNNSCRSIARKIKRERKAYSNAVARVKKGSQVANARESALQQYARFGCSSRSGASVTKRDTKPERKTLFERLFGGDDDTISDDDFYYSARETYRTVCVRTCDGYYWPVSFSTVQDHIYSDAGACESLATGEGQVDLYYYSNIGGSPEDMVNLNGSPYSALPNAFRYRREFDATCRVRKASIYGVINFGSDQNSSNAVITFGDISFPLPRRDPRQVLQVEVAAANFVPLPRPRPNLGGENVVAVVQSSSTRDLRLVIIGEKSVRLVGPDTPYAPTVAAGS
ncbi:DUF2865 domain-containing protein [Maritalea sp.]|uniref:DUF2865 domain-containing protein n=1 Tax=Maritalea sp. TaxID=2003361 RepID=UPI003F4ADF34